MRKFRDKIQILGPGLLYAGAAIGVSHLVQSTKAGALYGFTLIWAIVLANIMKYPAFAIAPRYYSFTKKTLVEGYYELGKTAMGFFLLIAIGTMFTIQAAVTIVTAGILQYLLSPILGLDTIPVIYYVGALFIVTSSILILGKYHNLDKAIKYIILVLTICTVACVISGYNGSAIKFPMGDFQWEGVGILFLIGLMGWMPAPLDLSVWHTLWSKEKQKNTSKKISLKERLLDFNVGYWGSAILAIAFVAMGAYVMFGSGITLSNSAGGFAKQIISGYKETLGKGAFIVVAIAAFATMFSTTLTCQDAISRMLQETSRVLGHRKLATRKGYMFYMFILIAGSILILSHPSINMAAMVTVATVLSFLAAPIMAYMNHLLLFKKGMRNNHPNWLRLWSWLGILFLTGFSIYYLTIAVPGWMA